MNKKRCEFVSRTICENNIYNVYNVIVFQELLSEFWDPLHISGTVEARNFKFGLQIGH